jgi:DNA-binding GntR family transcriptional regulator
MGRLTQFMPGNRRSSPESLLGLNKVSTPVSLKDQAYLAIKRAILSLQLKPGQALVEADLAEQLGISKTPVRTALHELEREGLVNKVLYKGTYVAEITLRDVREIFEIRAVLEGLGARLAAPAFQDADLAQAREILRLMEAALDMGDKDLASQYGQRFHESILQKADNQRLQLIVHNLDDQVQRFRLLSDQIRGRLRRSLGEHKVVLEALEQRDPDLAEESLKAHLHSVLHGLSAEQPLNSQDLREEVS